jgi:hypothetical protein
MTRPTMTLPRIFAVQRHDDAYLFESRRLDDDPQYWVGGDEGCFEIRPYSHDTRGMGIVAPSRERDSGGRCRVFIVEESDRRRHPDYWHRNDFNPYRRETIVRWQTVGSAIHLMSSPIPIPVLEFDADLPCTDRNRVHVVPSRPRDLEMWWEHWNPTRPIDRHRYESENESDSERDIRRRQRRARRGAAAGGGAAAAPPAPPPPVAEPAPIPKFVADTLIRDAVSRAATCPITMEPLAPETTAVTSCFHLFERDAIAAWMAQAGNCCAVCKQRTVLTV